MQLRHDQRLKKPGVMSLILIQLKKAGRAKKIQQIKNEIFSEMC